MRITRRALPLLATGLLARPALAAFPDRRITLTVPFVGGSSADTIARVIARPLGEELGQPIVVDNRAGAGGLLATQLTIRAAPDGYQLLFSGAQLSNIFWLRKTPEFDPVNDLTPVVRILNNAAVLHAAAITQTSLADYQRVIGVNQVGTFLGIRAVVEPMKRAGGGSIVNVSSIDGLQSKNGLIA